MSTADLVFLVGILLAFGVFATVLAYVDRIAGRRSDPHPAE
jgi:hypothetical protein